MHPDAVDLLSQLITPDLTKRLGNLHGGPEDVKNHPWFAEVTWDRLLRKDIDAPYVPPVRAGQGDASQFDKYPEENEAYGSTGEDPYVLFLSRMKCIANHTIDITTFSPNFDNLNLTTFAISPPSTAAISTVELTAHHLGINNLILYY